MIQDTAVIKAFKEVQNNITDFFSNNNSPLSQEDKWNYTKGSGGGTTRVWEDSNWIEKGGVNFAKIEGDQLPHTAISIKDFQEKTPFIATGVSLVIHPKNPFVPTIHMNIRYFKTNKTYWFGGGIDLTPTYPNKDQIIDFHKKLQEICLNYDQDYSLFKKQCDHYFFLPNRKETRGIGGLFFDQLKKEPLKTFHFVKNLGLNFPNLYFPFIHQNKDKPFTIKQKEFQELRRSRYVEFNLLYDRGTHFGLQSGGRTESILISMPKVARWHYQDNFPENSPEKDLINFYLKPQDWVNL